MIKCISSSPVKEWRISTDGELSSIPVAQAQMGDVVYSIASQTVWMFDGTAFVQQ